MPEGDLHVKQMQPITLQPHCESNCPRLGASLDSHREALEVHSPNILMVSPTLAHGKTSTTQCLGGLFFLTDHFTSNTLLEILICCIASLSH